MGQITGGGTGRRLCQASSKRSFASSDAFVIYLMPAGRAGTLAKRLQAYFLSIDLIMGPNLS
jgi:hypothetical protein